MAPDKVEHLGENTPLKRPGQPAELASAYVLLASDDGGCISEAIVPVTGGHPDAVAGALALIRRWAFAVIT